MSHGSIGRGGSQDFTSTASTRAPPVCSVSLVMTTFTACLVLIVAALCFSVTYTVSINQLRSIGRNYAESLVTTTSLRVADYLEFPAKQALAISMAFEREDIRLPLPKDDPQRYTTLKRVGHAIIPLFNSVNGSLIELFVGFGDGSFVVFNQIAGTDSGFGVFYINSALAVNATSGLGPFEAYGYDSGSDMRPISYVFDKTVDVANSTMGYSGQTPQYYTLIAYFTGSFGYWFPPIDVEVRKPVMPGCFPFRNASTLLGLGCFYVKADALTTFLADARGTANSHVFVVDIFSAIAATTYHVPFRTYRTLSPEEAAKMPFSEIPSNCYSTVTFRAAPRESYQYSCRTLAKDYPYPPLQVSVDEAMLFATGSGYTWYGLVAERRSLSVMVDDATYYVAAAAIETSFTRPNVPVPMHLLVFMPENDVIGDVVAVRNVLIAGTVAIFVAASVVAAVGILVILRPVRRIVARMTDEVHLTSMEPPDTESVEGATTFAIAEVEELRTAFGKMKRAVDSFERYVPRTVVKELIGAGNLCHIAMEHRACTMMFTQISRFSEMCDTVSMDLLAPLLQQYFARVSGIVAERDGVVDKFIGDTIMIVWGAPKETADREKKAVLSGLLIVRAAKQAPLHHGFQAIGERLRIRVGVASGLVLAGNMGSSERMNYTVIGDAVNMASQLLEWCRTFSLRLLIDSSTAHACRADFCMHRVAPTTLPEAPYNVLGLRRTANISATIRSCLVDCELQELVVDPQAVEIAHVSDVACEAYATRHYDDCIALTRAVDEMFLPGPLYCTRLREAAQSHLDSGSVSIDSESQSETVRLTTGHA